MKYLRFLFVFASIFIIVRSATPAQTYKQMMNDPNVNFYDVVKEAEAYFEHRDKGKGSGWAPFQRWKHANESHFYPSGVRNQSSPYFAQEAYQAFIRQMNYSNRKMSASENGWKDWGPYTIDKISGHYAPGLGRVECFYVYPNDTMKIFLGSRSGGFWRTLDGGRHWECTTDFLPSSGVNSIAVSPTNPNQVLINVRNSNNGVTQGIYRSLDGGGTWNVTKFNPTNLKKGGLGSNFSVNKVVYSPHAPGMVFVTASDGLYRSTDNLDTWTKVTNGSISEIEFHPSNTSLVYIYDYYYWGANKNVILRSVNQGQTFTATNTIVGNNDNTSVTLGVSTFGCQDCLFFASGNGVWKSTDNGNSFTFLSNPKTGNGAFAVNDMNPNNMLTGGIDVVVSADGGKTFQQKTWWALSKDHPFTGPNYVHADLREAECIRGVFYLATDGYLSKSTDGGNTWTRLSEGTGIRENYAVGVSQSNSFRNICGSQDNGQSLSTENGWLEIYGADGMEGIIHPLNYKWMIGSWQNGGRLRTKDGSVTNQGVTPPGQKNAAWVAPLLFDPNNHMRVYSFSDSIYVSDNFGSNWVNIGPTTVGTAEKAVIAENNSNIILVSSGAKLSKSTDGGKTFTAVKGLPNYGITDIGIDPNDDNTIIVTYNRYEKDSSKVFISQDFGLTWKNITYNLQDMPIYSVVIDHTPQKNIYLGAEIGVFTKPMNATEWTLFSTDLPNMSVLDLEVQYGTNSLRAATWGRGLWSQTLINRIGYPTIPMVTTSVLPTENLPVESVPVVVSAAVKYNDKISSVFVKWSKDTPEVTSIIPMTLMSDSTYRATGPLPDVPAGTKIYFKVYAVGSKKDTTETYKYMYTVNPFKYCDALGADGTGSDYINSIRLAGVSTTSKQEKYADFTKTTIELVTDSVYTLQIGMNYHFAPDTTSGWIDYNHNAIFEKNEQIVMSQIDSLHQSFGTFRVPRDVAKDTTRLRVRSQYNSETPEPCGTRTGEVEDYTIVFKHAPPKVTFDVNQSALCGPSYIRFTYTGDPADSLRWVLSNSSYNFTSTKLSDSIRLTNAGLYTLKLTAYNKGVGLPAAKPMVISLVIIDTSITRIPGGLRAGADSARYQWLNCAANHQPIPGATARTYQPQSDGLYAVEIQQNGCTDTSLCYNVQAVGVEENPADNTMLSVYPNPTSGELEITVPLSQEMIVNVYDIHGKMQLEHAAKQTERIKLNMNSLPDGVYYLKIQSNGHTMYRKIVKTNDK
ncbi:MAG: GEVED domain-containing protein [Candidatus Kapaibacterium sp.]